MTTRGIEGLWWKATCGLLMLVVIYGAFFVAKGAVNFVGTGDITPELYSFTFRLQSSVRCGISSAHSIPLKC